jgi:hypothetical protein
LAIVAAMAFPIAACDSFLDKAPEENTSLEQTFAERAYVERWLYNIYSGIPIEMNLHLNVQKNPFVGGSDEMEITSDVAWANLINSSSVSAASNFEVWGNTAVFTRRCNLFFENIHLTPATAQEKREWTGEVHFLRAFFNFMAVRMYGPIPLYDHSLGIETDFTKIERATFQQCVDFIVEDCDRAIEMLPARQMPNRYGRANAAAAYALKARMLLYAASPLYNGNPDYSEFVNAAGEKMFPDYSRDRWQRAADAAKECIDFCEGLLPGTKAEYRLYEAASGDPADSHEELFTNNHNIEVIYANNVGQNLDFEQCVNPVSANGRSQYAPTQQMVDAYRMSDGSLPFLTDTRGQVAYSASGQPTVNQLSGYTESGFAAEADPKGNYAANASNMFVGREPRFYAHINFCGRIWKGTLLEMWNTGKDGAKSAGANLSKTGYLMRKYADEGSVTGTATPILKARSWIWFRLGEVYLNYAEALNEAKDVMDVEVYTYLNRVRVRGGLPEIADTPRRSQEEMRQLIRQERRVELAFETHRFFDVRRWKIAEYTDAGSVYGLNVNGGNSLADPEFYQRTMVERRRFIAPRNYLFPIWRTEREKDPALIQNPGY